MKVKIEQNVITLNGWIVTPKEAFQLIRDLAEALLLLETQDRGVRK